MVPATSYEYNTHGSAREIHICSWIDRAARRAGRRGTMCDTLTIPRASRLFSRVYPEFPEAPAMGTRTTPATAVCRLMSDVCTDSPSTPGV